MNFCIALGHSNIYVISVLVCNITKCKKKNIYIFYYNIEVGNFDHAHVCKVTVTFLLITASF